MKPMFAYAVLNIIIECVLGYALVTTYGWVVGLAVYAIAGVLYFFNHVAAQSEVNEEPT